MYTLATEECTPHTENGKITLPMFTTVVGGGQASSLIQNINREQREELCLNVLRPLRQPVVQSVWEGWGDGGTSVQ